MLKVKGMSAMVGAANVIPITVFAAKTEEDKTTISPLTQDELSLYSAPPQRIQTVEQDAGQLEESVATVRKYVEPYAVWCLNTYNRIKPRVQSVVQIGGDAYASLKNPPDDLLPRLGIIGFTGILGLFLARGSRIKRIVYPAGLMAVSTSLYYPEKTATIVKSTGEKVYDCTVQGYAAVEKMLNPAAKPEKSNDSGTNPP